MEDKKISAREIIFLVILAAAVFAMRLPHMQDPLDRDEGLFAYAASATYNAQLPYRDVFDRNPPLIFYIYRAAFDTGGVSVDSIRTFTLVYLILTIILIYMFVRTFSTPAAAMSAALLYAAFMNGGNLQLYGAGSGVFTAFPALFAVFFMLDRDRTYERANFFLAGFLMCAVFLTKTLMLAAALAPLLYMIFFMKEKNSRGRGILWYLFGFSAFAALAVLWALKNGILHEFIEGFISYNVVFSGVIVKAASWERAFFTLADFAKTHALLAAAYVYSIVSFFVRKDKAVHAMVFLYATLILAAAISMKSASPQNYAALIPFLCVSGALMINDAAAAAGKTRGGKTAAAAVLIVLLGAGIAWHFYSSKAAPFSAKSPADTLSYEARRVAGEIPAAGGGKISLFVWPNDPEIYFYTGISPRSRFVNSYPYGYFGNELNAVMTGLLYDPPDYLVLMKGVNDNLFDNLLKTYYSKSAEGIRLVLYKKGGIHEKSK